MEVDLKDGKEKTAQEVIIIFLIHNTDDKSLLVAIYNQTCGNGFCVAPGMCMCTEGWEGENCMRGNLSYYILNSLY